MSVFKINQSFSQSLWEALLKHMLFFLGCSSRLETDSTEESVSEKGNAL